VLLVTLDDESTRNALSQETMTELNDVLDRFGSDPSCNVLVLTGAGTVFCSGGDTRKMGSARPDPWAKREYLRRGVGRLAATFLGLDKPVLGMINGAAVGAGMDLALWCDLRWATSDAYFLPGFVDLGVTPGFGSAWHLTRELGRSRALQILLTGDSLTSEQALTDGLLLGVHDTVAELTEQVLDVAARLAAKPAPAMRATKRLVQRADLLDIVDHLDLAWASFAILQETPEHGEAVRRLGERRGRRREET
jgi:enoyl-CoA hydratase/carnithine racemase